MDKKFQSYERKREDDCTENESEYEYECDNCGQASMRIYCSRECYLICKADYQADQERD